MTVEEGFLGEHSGGASFLSELSWPAPVRVGDVLTLTVEIMKKRESKSRQYLGLIEIKNQLVNQNGEVALQAVPTMLIAMKDDSEGNYPSPATLVASSPRVALLRNPMKTRHNLYLSNPQKRKHRG